MIASRPVIIIQALQDTDQLAIALRTSIPGPF